MLSNLWINDPTICEKKQCINCMILLIYWSIYIGSAYENFVKLYKCTLSIDRFNIIVLYVRRVCLFFTRNLLSDVKKSCDTASYSWLAWKKRGMHSDNIINSDIGQQSNCRAVPRYPLYCTANYRPLPHSAVEHKYCKSFIFLLSIIPYHNQSKQINLASKTSNIK